MIKKIIGILLVLFFVVGCGTQNLKPTEDIISITIKTLEIAKEFRHVGLCVAGDLYKDNLISEEEKNEIIKFGDELQEAINDVAFALEMYIVLSDEENLIALKDKLAVYQKLYILFARLVVPLL
ncbi:MAG: hypothetical protein KAJ10_02920 [Thermodesulfovibrionia bacterium]|nr:hypothetical protein [Thermodesulfovibrionia bacterium]